MSMKHGVTGQPIPCTRLLGKLADLKGIRGFVCRSYYLVVINDANGTFTTATVKDGNLGRTFDPAKHTYPLPEDETWAKKGYRPFDPRNFDVVAWCHPINLIKSVFEFFTL